MLAFAACEKCEKPLFAEDPFVNASDRNAEKEGNQVGGRSDGDLPVIEGDVHGDGDITDPNEDEDYDGIVDPDEDEDFDKDGK